MSKSTATLEASDTTTCPCDFNMDPSVHAQLLSVESLPALEALELVAELAMCEIHPGFDAGTSPGSPASTTGPTLQRSGAWHYCSTTCQPGTAVADWCLYVSKRT